MTAVETRWQQWASFALGLWLALSPWIVGYAEREAATANAVFVGIVLALGSHFDASFEATLAPWINIAAGAWLVAAPFVLAFNAPTDVAATSISVGALVVALAASALSLDKGIGRWWHKRIGH